MRESQAFIPPAHFATGAMVYVQEYNLFLVVCLPLALGRETDITKTHTATVVAEDAIQDCNAGHDEQTKRSVK